MAKHALDVNELKRTVLKDGRATCFHRIMEGAKYEFMAMIHGSNVRRWGLVQEKKQEWLIVPADAEGYCHVINRENHELLGATLTGTLWVAPATGGEEQRFRFVNPRPLGETIRIAGGILGFTVSYNIMVGREGKYVGASRTGDFVRWDRDPNDPGQDFFLVPIEEKPVPELAIREPRDRQAGFAPPAISGLAAELPAESEPQEVGVEVLPSVLVQDPAWSDRVAQVERHPYYALRKYRLWRSVYDETFVEGIERSLETTVQIGMSEEDVKEIERTIGVVVNAKLSGEMSGSAGTKDGGTSTGSAKKVSGALSVTYRNQVTELERHASKSEKRVEMARGVKIGNKGGVRVVAWQEVERYVLENLDGNRVQSWDDARDRVEWVESSSLKR